MQKCTMNSQRFEIIAKLLNRYREDIVRTGNSQTLAQFDNSFIPTLCEELKEINPQFKPELFAQVVNYGPK